MGLLPCQEATGPDEVANQGFEYTKFQVYGAGQKTISFASSGSLGILTRRALGLGFGVAPVQADNDSEAW